MYKDSISPVKLLNSVKQMGRIVAILSIFVY